MQIRCASKAIIIDHNRVLLNCCRRKNGDVYYDLPGGGQNVYELMEQALVREVKEETGYTVRIVRFAALTEEIYTSPEIQKAYPSYTHRIMHVFMAELVDETPHMATEKDYQMDRSVWVPLEEVAALPAMHPTGLQACFSDIVRSPHPVYMGTRYIHEDEV